MVKKNGNFLKLQPSYLFPEIEQKKQKFLAKNPQKNVINLGIGDTTHPIPQLISAEICAAANKLATSSGYTGYGPEQGNPVLRKLIADTFYSGMVSHEEIFISDGAKCDTGRLPLIFENELKIAVQDPTYPVYLDTSVIAGKGGKIIRMPCHAENDFFPDLDKIESVDLIYFCSPNNPSGNAATKAQLKTLIDFATERKAILVYDSAYAFFITDDKLPHTIYEIEGADKVAIEISSFSKIAGFTGIRLGWSVFPKSVLFEDGTTLHSAWSRIASTFFNGASSLAEAGGIAVLKANGLKQIAKMKDYYLENAALIKGTFESLEMRAFGGNNAPYVWVDFSPKSSWEIFSELLETTQVLSIPGVGFGPSGEGYLRFSAFAPREQILEAMARVSQYFGTVLVGATHSS